VFVVGGVRAIITKGWSGRMGSKSGDMSPPLVPAECFFMDEVPHDWLFPRIDAALHHGGAGTTGASLRAGIPTIIKPWFGDQFFWASRVTVLGVRLRKFIVLWLISSFEKTGWAQAQYFAC